MKTTISAIAIALAATLAQPAPAITFPKPTTIYVGAGVVSTTTVSATVVHCSNVSGHTATVRFLILFSASSFEHIVFLAHGHTWAVATQPTVSLFEDHSFDPGFVIHKGVLNVESTQSGVFCTAKVVAPNVSEIHGVALPLVRVNPHPGTVE